MNGDGNEGEEEEDHVAQGALPVGGHGERRQLTGDGVHLVSGAHQNESGDGHVERRIAGHEHEDAVRVGRQPDVVLTCRRVKRPPVAG